MTLSEYGFDFNDGEDAGLGENEQSKGPKWFREGLDKLSNQNKELREKIQSLEAEKAKTELADTLRAAGIDPGAAALYQGEPDKVDDWLNANKAWLKPLETSGEGEQQEEQEQAPQGPPASTVPAEGQEQMQRMQEAGTQGVAPPAGSDKEAAAAIAALASPEDLAAYMKSQGNPYDWS